MKIALLLILTLGAVSFTFAQKLTAEDYHATVVTRQGKRIRGVLDDVTVDKVYLTGESATLRIVPLDMIRKVVVRRDNKRPAVRTGAIIGGLVFGFFTVEGLKKNPTSNPISAGLTLLLATGTGAAVGAGAGAIVGNVASRVVRPGTRDNQLDDLRRQLEPFSVRYQRDVLRRVNQ